MQMVGGNGGNQFRQYARQNVGNLNGNQNGLIVVPGIANPNANQIRNGNVVAAWAEGNANGNKDLVADCSKGRGRDPTLNHPGTQTDKPPVYDSDRSTEVHHSKNCYNNDIFNMFTQEEQYTELLEPIPEPHQVQQNDSNVISAVSNVEQSGGTVEQHPATVEETHALYDSIHKIVKDEIFPIVDQVDARLQNFGIQFLKEATKFVRDFKSLVKEADESLAKQKALEFEIGCLLRAV
ncbi:hypothetical protein Tco_1314561 [Tanacetum coccineum]